MQFQRRAEAESDTTDASIHLSMEVLPELLARSVDCDSEVDVPKAVGFRSCHVLLC